MQMKKHLSFTAVRGKLSNRLLEREYRQNQHRVKHNQVKHSNKYLMDKCNRCILPNNYPGIIFNDRGICNYCLTYKSHTYKGGEALKEKIFLLQKTTQYTNRDYDCILAFSGGRDSSYLLYYLTKVLGLRVLAYCADNGFIPQQTIINIHHMTNILNVKLVIERHDYLKNCLKHHLTTWIRNPSPATIGLICSGCRLGTDVGLINFSKSVGIPIIIKGTTPFEGQGYKINIMKINPKSKSPVSFVLGYLYHILKTPRWIMNPVSLSVQVKEYYYHYLKKAKKNISVIAPFYSYIKWHEREIISTIMDKLEWKKNPNSKSTWRGDCDIALLKSYFYKITLGFNDYDDYLSSLVRDGQISREEALERLTKKGSVPKNLIKSILAKLGVNYSEFRIAMTKVGYKL